MDANESEQKLRKHSSSSSARRPLLPAENKNGSTRPARPKEVSSRYKSPTPSSTDRSKRSPSPVINRPSSTSTIRGPRQSISAERNRPSRPSSPIHTSKTPVQDTNSETLSSARKSAGSKLPEALWPSTMRSLSVSFQSDTISVSVSKKEKPAPTLSVQNLRSLSNALPSRAAESSASRKPTPERKKSPLKGKVASSDQTENGKLRLVDQHKWPSRTSGIVSSSGAMNRSVDLTDKKSKIPSFSRPITVAPSSRRLSLDGATRPLEKSSSDLLMEMSRDLRRSADDSSVRMQRPTSSSSSDQTPSFAKTATRALSSPVPPPRPSSPSLTRGVSPVRGRAVVSSSSRGPQSPSRARPSSPSRQPQGQGKASVLSFIADIKQGQKAANHIEEVHQLRLLYNRQLQWRFANAQADAASFYQKLFAEKLLYGVWRMILHLQESVREKRNFLQHLRIKLKLYSVLNNQLIFLDDWASMETDHANSLNWAIQDLQASTIQIPVVGGAKGDTERVKAAICSAADVMQGMGTSSSFLLPLVEAISRLVSDLASLSADERAMLDECKSLLTSTTAVQVEENSLRTHILQMKQARLNAD